MNNIKSLVGKGALAGLAGGVAAALFQWIVTEDQIRAALAIEAAARADHGNELVSRSTQVIGGMVAAGIYGTLIGVVFAMVCAGLWRGLSGRSAFARSIRLATVAYVAWVLVPALKYPANPPGVGEADTVGQRTAAFVAIMIVSLGLAYLAWELWQRLTQRGLDGAARFAAVAGSYLAAITVTFVLLPESPDPVDVPADLIWHFRLDSLAGSALMWAMIGIVFGWLGDRDGGRRRTSKAGNRSAVSV